MAQLTAAIRQAVFDLAAAGRTLDAIINVTGLPAETCRMFWIEFRCSDQRRRSADRHFRKRVLRLERQGLNQKQIAHRLTASERQVFDVLMSELEAS